MFSEFWNLTWLAPREELLSFLKLWGWLFAAGYTLRLVQRFGRWAKAKREARRIRKFQKKNKTSR
jgi:hypothetical protein